MSVDDPSTDNFWDEKSATFSNFIYGNRINIFLILLGLIFLGSGILLFRNFNKDSDIEIVESVENSGSGEDLVVEIAGAVEKPGVYCLPQNSRIEDLLIKAGGLSADADREWTERYINRAAKLIDGQKIFLPKKGEQSMNVSANNPRGDVGGVLGNSESYSGLININTASQKELESLSGIGPVYAQSIIEHRPYSSTEELLSKSALKEYVYEKIKDKVTVY